MKHISNYKRIATIEDNRIVYEFNYAYGNFNSDQLMLYISGYEHLVNIAEFNRDINKWVTDIALIDDVTQFVRDLELYSIYMSLEDSVKLHTAKLVSCKQTG
jgi:hypothetical protein